MEDSSREGGLRYLVAAVGCILAGLLFYSQVHAFSWDEGFHLLAAQLILHGKRPYLDFCFPQTPLNAYLTAGWMRIFGESWRAVHVLETLCVAGAAFLTADFIRARFPVKSWRTAGAMAAAVAVGMNSQVVIFGTIGQSYGLGLLLVVAAFRLAIVAVERGGSWAAGAGFLAGAAAGSTLLTAPAGPVIFLWIAIRNRKGSTVAKLAAYAAGAAIAFLPIAWLYREGPEQTIFNIALYQMKYRHHWNGALSQDITALTSWIDSAQGLALGLLGLAGVWFLWKCDWDRERRWEFYLAIWLAAGMSAELAMAHPTFERYFMLVIPFFTLPAIVGLYAVGSQLSGAEHSLRTAAVLIVILCLGCARALYQDSDSYSWSDIEKIAHKVEMVTPPNGQIWADELIYFVLRRPPPDGMEFAYAHEIPEMPARQAAVLHILTASELQRRANAGEYSTVAACYDTDNTDAAKVPDLYRQKETIRDCTVYWDFGKKAE